MARPRKPVDEERIRKLAGEGCTHQEIAIDQNVSTDTIAAHYTDIIKKGQSDCYVSFRRKCLMAAFPPPTSRDKPNVGFAVLFAKMMGWYVDKVEEKSESKIKLSNETVDKIQKAAKCEQEF